MSEETKDKHTPGDWNVEIYQDSADTRAARVWTDRPETEGGKANPDICHVYAIGDDGRLGGEMEANAKLISASPDLIAALFLCVWNYEDEIKQTDAWQRMHLGYVDREPTPSHIMHARAAIDKARNG